MARTPDKADSAKFGDPTRRDQGMSFVELLVAIVLIGTVVVAVLAGVRATIIASTVDREHTTAIAWLQSASDVLYGEARADCGNLLALVTGYESVIRATPNNEGWDPNRIRVGDVKFWDGSSFGTTCNAQTTTLQLITLDVVDGDGQILETLDIVKGGDVGGVEVAP